MGKCNVCYEFVLTINYDFYYFAMNRKTISFVTGNQKKLEEFTAILGKTFPYNVESVSIDLPEFQGECDDISRAKCKAAANIIKGPVIVEDTCLCFTAFGGLPGPYIKWFADQLQPKGLYRMLSDWNDKSATAICTFAYSDGPDHDNILLFKGEVRGEIVDPRGPSSFGWDPCFQPIGFDKTYAEMSSEEKNKISHRSLAIKHFKEHFSRE